jgi:hypothetical protein
MDGLREGSKEPHGQQPAVTISLTLIVHDLYYTFYID